jgi:hypothetical protein
MQVQPENATITTPGDEAIRVLQEIEVLLVSIHRMGSHYFEHPGESYNAELSRFVTEWHVAQRLAAARQILTEQFDLSLGVDDMDDLERAVEGLPIWSMPGCAPPEKP